MFAGYAEIPRVDRCDSYVFAIYCYLLHKFNYR
jgi:hypothetical protein